MNLNQNNTNKTHKCPECGESHYQELYTTSTALYCPPVYKNGMLICEDDINKVTTHYRCCNCGNEFTI